MMTRWDDIAGGGLPIRPPHDDHDPNWKPAAEPLHEVESPLNTDTPRLEEKSSKHAIRTTGLHL